MSSSLWFPYAQMKTLTQCPEVISANKASFTIKGNIKLIDGISSWWSVIHGYNHPNLNKAAKQQIDTFSHIMMCGLTHKPALQLSKKLVSITPKGLNHVFFSDSGSVGCEVAIKMAIQYWMNKGKPKKHKLLALKKAYHGDTTGVMAVSDPDDGMHALFHNILTNHHFLPSPGFNIETDIHHLKVFLENNHEEIAAFIVEPLMQAAGGFNMYPAEFLNKAKKLCKAYNVLLIADEVATGFGRTGSLFAMDQTTVSPDIMVLGKGLTGGYLGLSATLASSDVYNAFLGDSASNCFMHGPTFMGNPLACSVANASVDLCLEKEFLIRIKEIEHFFKAELLDFKSKFIKDIRILGATAVIEVHKENSLKKAQDYAIEKGVWLRPFSRFFYAMPPYCISNEELTKITSTMKSYFKTIN